MSAFHPNPSEVKRRRALVEARLSRLIENAQIVLTIEDIKVLTFYHPHERFDAYIQQMFAIFDAGGHPVDEDTLLPVIQDAWNYFPHRSLNGRSPAEVFAVPA
jgi:hypothetical protein